MTAWLLDTNVLSELKRPKPAMSVVTFVANEPLELLFVSSVTLAEIRFGIELLTDANRRAKLTTWLDQEMRPLFNQRIINIDEDVLLQWRLMVEAGRKSGHTLSHPDILIAASAAVYGLTVVTRNTSDFAGTEVATFDPWTGNETKPR